MTPSPAKTDRQTWAALAVIVAILVQTVVFSLRAGAVVEAVDNMKGVVSKLDDRVTYLERHRVPVHPGEIP
jgi:hypothetical protein